MDYMFCLFLVFYICLQYVLATKNNDFYPPPRDFVLTVKYVGYFFAFPFGDFRCTSISSVGHEKTSSSLSLASQTLSMFSPGTVPINSDI
jgi:hypothetical protein